MVVHARIVLFSWAWPLTATSERLTPGPAPVAPTQRSVVRGVQPVSRRAGLVGWRALGANNRELGRAASPATSLEQARTSVHATQLAFARATTRIVREAGVGWTWRILLDDEWVVASSRRYQRQRECGYSLVQFSELFPGAEVLAPPTQLLRALGRDQIALPAEPTRPAQIVLPGHSTRPSQMKCEVIT